MLPVKETPEGLSFMVYVQPRSAKNQISGLYGDALKVKLTAPPVEGTANTMCIAYLAKRLRVPKYWLEILSGHAGRTKRLMVKAKAGAADTERVRLKRSLQVLAAPKTP